MSRLPLSVICVGLVVLAVLFEVIFYPIAAAALAGSIGLFAALFVLVVRALKVKEMTSSEVAFRSQMIFAASLAAILPVIAVRCFIEVGEWDLRCMIGLRPGVLDSVWQGVWSLLVWWVVMTCAALGDIFFMTQRRAGLGGGGRGSDSS